MDYNKILQIAEENAKAKAKNGYNTKFGPPKKDKKAQALSDNIKKFLARKDAEEKAKLEAERQRKENLLALRAQDKKSTRRVNTMISRTKSANRSVIQDFGDKINTAVTELVVDDYGYVSPEASAIYDRMVEKYSKVSDKRSCDISMQSNSRKRKHAEEEDGMKEQQTLPKRHKTAPISFSDLMQIAETNRREPAVSERKEEKLFTMKQKEELDRRREVARKLAESNKQCDDKGNRKGRVQNIPQVEPNPNKSVTTASIEKSKRKAKDENNYPKPNQETTRHQPVENPHKKSSTVATSAHKNRSNSLTSKPRNQCQNNDKANSKLACDVATRQVSFKKQTEELKSLSFPGKIQSMKPVTAKLKHLCDTQPKQFSTLELKPKQFPPPDLRKQQCSKKRSIVVKKGRILDDDDSEYDSEMDDFIDDDETEVDYSKHIRDIFGYDKRKYQGHDDDISNMESTFAQQMKEEAMSKKLAIREDLEELKKEREYERRKAIAKKKYSHK